MYRTFVNLRFLPVCLFNEKNQHEGYIVTIEFTPQEIPPPEFVLNKPEIQWSEEEKKVYKEYEKKNQKLSEEREKYRKV